MSTTDAVCPGSTGMRREGRARSSRLGRSARRSLAAILRWLVLAEFAYALLFPGVHVTYRDPIVLARSSYPELYSSHYLDWLDRATAEYRVAVAQLGHTVGQFIVGHRQLTPQVFETRYEDGTRVVVNYGDQAYEGDGMRVEGLGYLVIAE